MGILIFDAELCTGCRACEIACSFRCEKVFQPSKARIRIVKIDEEGIDVPVGCQHCETPMCMEVCPVRAIYRNSIEAVLIDNSICIGCKECMVVCPFGAIQFDQEKRILYKCDLCEGEPECVKWCFTKAIEYHEKINNYLQRKKRKYGLKVMSILQNKKTKSPGGES
jgi:Fe-S-cluster-containing hydrogenase component 2